MRVVRRVGLIAIALCTAVFLHILPAHAETVTVTIGVGDTILQVSGRTSPDAFVTISKDGGVIGTVLADSSGEYSQTFPAQEPGLHTLSLYAQTPNGTNTDTVSLTVNIAEHATTAASVFLPSTIAVEDSDLGYGEELRLSGEAAPSSTITVYIDNSSYATVTTDAQGKWKINLDTTILPSGQHEFFVRVTDGFGEQSYPTATRDFFLAAQQKEPSPVVPGGQAPRPPVITFPTQDMVWRQPTITVTGTAGPGVQIELWDGNSIIGSVWSGRGGEWSMLLHLDPKEYSLRARACLNQKCSAFSPTIHFKYESGGPVSPVERPLRISVPQAFFTIYEHQTVPLEALVLDGQPPYEVKIRWGDGKTEARTYVRNELLFLHSYSKPGNYTVTVDVQDAQGRKNRIYFSIHVIPLQQPNVFPIIILFVLLAILTFLLLLHKKRKNAAKLI